MRSITPQDFCSGDFFCMKVCVAIVNSYFFFLCKKCYNTYKTKQQIKLKYKQTLKE